MSGLGHFLESEGIATVCIALVREHAEAMRPPRALWVPFPLGRPFGVPDDAAFQRRVLLAALELLDAPAGPVLADFPEDAPAEPDELAGEQVCPVSFAPAAEEESLAARVVDEISRLRTWYERGLEQRGRTTVGVGGRSPEDAARWLAAFVAGDVSSLDGAATVDVLRWSADDLKAYYTEAVLAQPGRVPGEAVQRWLWRETALSALLREARQVCLASSEAALRDVGNFMLVPRAWL